MPMKPVIQHLPPIFLTILVVCLTLGYGQDRKIWSPPGKSFTVEVPADLKEFDAGYSDSANTDGDGYENIRTFGLVQKPYVFQVLVLRLRAKQITKTLEDKLGGLEFVFGGDDDHDFSETYLKVDGFPAKEIVYKKQNTKGLMIDTGDRIFVLGLSAEKRKDLNKSISRRFFNSFRLVKKKN